MKGKRKKLKKLCDIFRLDCLKIEAHYEKWPDFQNFSCYLQKKNFNEGGQFHKEMSKFGYFKKL